MDRLQTLILALSVSPLMWPAPPLAGLQGQESTPTLEIRIVDSDAHTFTAEERRVIQREGDAALAEIAGVLPGVPARIELLVQAGAQVIPETGDGGAALAPGQIGWTVDPTRPGGVAELARTRLRFTLFHEVHHLVRGWTMAGQTAGTRMIDAAVSEGMATAFERDAAGSKPPWGDYPADDVAGWVEDLLGVTGGLRDYTTWMFYHSDGRRWIGYRSGTYLVDQAIAASGRSAGDLVHATTDEILGLAAISAGQ
jgi:hypothetical protein